MGTSDGIAGNGDERGRTGVALFYLFIFLPLKALQVGDDGLGVGSYLRF